MDDPAGAIPPLPLHSALEGTASLAKRQVGQCGISAHGFGSLPELAGQRAISPQLHPQRSSPLHCQAWRRRGPWRGWSAAVSVDDDRGWSVAKEAAAHSVAEHGGAETVHGSRARRATGGSAVA